MAFEAALFNVSSLLQPDFEYIVEGYQRRYSWESQVSRFVKDIFFIQEEKLEEYYLGSIVLIEKSPNNFQIIDGQQRLTTILIFLSVLRELSSNKKFKEKIDSYFFFENKDKRFYKLTLNGAYNDFFINFVLSEQSEKYREEINPHPKMHSKKLIGNAFLEIKKLMESKIAKEGLNLEIFISDIFDVLTKNVNLMKIKTKSIPDASLIFETLNTRGKTLEDFENIKNHIFGHAHRSQFEQIKSTWEELLNNYSTQKFSRYIMIHYISKYKKIMKSELFDEFVNNKKINFLDFTYDLQKEFAILEQLSAPTIDYWESDEIVKNLEILNKLNFSQVYYLLLASKVSNFYFKEILDFLVAFSFKFKFSKNNPNKVENKFPDWANKIRINSSLSLPQKIKFEDIEKDLNGLVNPLSTIESTFLDTEESDTLLKKIMFLINENILKKCGKKLILDSKLTIEHIYGKDSSDEFSKEVKEVEDELKIKYKRRLIWNTTLLSKKKNKDISCYDFNKKSEEGYSIENYIPTNEFLSKYKKFDSKFVKEYREYIWKEVKSLFKLRD